MRNQRDMQRRNLPSRRGENFLLGGMVGFVILVVIANAAFWGVVVWAIIKLVNANT